MLEEARNGLIYQPHLQPGFLPLSLAVKYHRSECCLELELPLPPRCRRPQLLHFFLMLTVLSNPAMSFSRNLA